MLGILFLHSFFVSNEYFDIVGEPKTYAFYFLAATLIIIFSIKRIFTADARDLEKLNLPDLLFLLFYTYIVIDIIHDKDIPFLNKQFIVITLCYCIYFIAKCEARNNLDPGKSTFQIFFGILAFIALIQCILGLLQLAGILKNLNDYFKIGGSYGNPSQYSNMLSAIMPAELAAILYLDRKKHKYIYFISLIALILSSIIIILLTERTSWLAAGFSLLVVIWYRYSLAGKSRNVFNNIFKKLALTIILLATVIFVAFSLYSYKKDSAFGRVFIWKISGEILKEQSLLGVGFEKFNAAHNIAKSEYFNSNPVKNIDEERNTDDARFAYNEYLQIAVEFGIIGIVLFGGAIVILLLARYPNSIKDVSEIKFVYIASFSCFIALLVEAFFSYPFRQWSTISLFFICGGILSAHIEKQVIQFNLSKLSRLFYLALIICAIGFIVLENNKRNSAKLWARAAFLSKNGHYKEAEHIYESVYNDLSYDPDFLFNYGYESYFMGDFNRSIEILKKVKPVLENSGVYIGLGNSLESLKQYGKAEEAYLHALSLIPYKIYPRYKLALLYKKTGQKNKAIELAKEILNFKPKIYHSNIDVIKIEMSKLLNEYDEK